MTTLSLRDRRHQQAMKDCDRLERQRDEALDKLTRIAGKLKIARKAVERYEKPRTPAPLPVGQPLDREMIEAVTKAIGHPPVNPVKVDRTTQLGVLGPAPIDDLEIPGFLKRTKLDPVAQAIKDEQDELKRTKSRGRIETMKAKQRGDTKRMPLSGRAALEAIRG